MLTTFELDALARGLATVHNGRIIPIIRGGSDEDPGGGDDPADPVDDSAADAVDDPAPAPDAPAEDLAVDDPAPPAAAAIDWTSPDAQQAVAQFHQQYVQQNQPPAPPAEPPPGFDWETVDPYDEDSFGKRLGEGIRHEIAQANAPVERFVETMQERETREFADTTLTELGVADEDRGVVMQFAAGVGVAAEAAGQQIGLKDAIQHATKIVQDRDQRITKAAADAAVEQYKADLEAKANPGTGEPAGPGTPGVGIRREPDNLVDAAIEFAERGRLAS